MRVQVQLLPPPPIDCGLWISECVLSKLFVSARQSVIGNPHSAINNRRTCSSAESERDSAKVEVARSNRARSTKRPLTRRAADTATRRHGDTENTSSPCLTFAASPRQRNTGVAQSGGGASLRN